jgi:glycosyltransferase involved in cell wall biosynthesis
VTARKMGVPPEMASPRILYVLSCWPHDQAYGGQIRALHLARALTRIGRVSLAIVGADPVPAEVRLQASQEFEVAGEWTVEATGVRRIGALVKALLDPDFVNIHGLALARASECEIRALMADFDLVWFFQLRTANYFRNARWPDAVVDVDNLPSSTIESRGRAERNSISRIAHQTRAWMVRRHERLLTARFGVVAVCSEADRRVARDGSAIRVIPNGFELPRGDQPRLTSDPPRIGFIGLLEYEPNRDGIRWFLERCWPALRAAVPGIRLRLAGKGGDGAVDGRIDGVDVLGWIEDAGAEMATWSLTVIPIFSGAGTRIKVADAFSRRCPVVSTSLGAYGYEVEDGRELRLADTPEEFVSACLDLLRQPAATSEMAERAWHAYLQHWTWEAIAPRVWEAAEVGLRLRRESCH